jgi:hypothetical protein
VIGALAQATQRSTVTTAVTCPTVRIHPAIIAQAAATSAVLLEGRFRLGVGSGEALNEHILGDPDPVANGPGGGMPSPTPCCASTPKSCSATGQRSARRLMH